MKRLRIGHRLLGACCLVLMLGGCSWLIPDLAPTAVITAAPDSGTAPLLVRLSASLSDDDAGILEYTWEFPDQDADAVHTLQTEHEYVKSGDYRVRLTVVDSAGQSDSCEAVITVVNKPPIASCRLSNDAPVPRESVLFDASASVDTDGTLIDFIWDFGDGATQRGTRVSHTYEEIGLYTVRLTVVDNAGALATISHTMTVHVASSGGGCGGR
jgi:PKD repeat protein